MSRTIIQTSEAPAAIGTYSQAVQTTGAPMTFISGQIPLHPETMTLVSDAFDEQAHRVFINLRAIAEAAGGRLSDCVNNYLPYRSKPFATVNEVMANTSPNPTHRAAIEVSAPPKRRKSKLTPSW